MRLQLLLALFGRCAVPALAQLPATPSWTQRPQRVFEIDACARCQGRLRVIASLEEPELIARILAHRERSMEMAEREHLPIAARAPPRRGLLR